MSDMCGGRENISGADPVPVLKGPTPATSRPGGDASSGAAAHMVPPEVDTAAPSAMQTDHPADSSAPDGSGPTAPYAAQSDRGATPGGNGPSALLMEGAGGSSEDECKDAGDGLGDGLGKTHGQQRKSAARTKQRKQELLKYLQAHSDQLKAELGALRPQLQGLRAKHVELLGLKRKLRDQLRDIGDGDATTKRRDMDAPTLPREGSGNGAEVASSRYGGPSAAPAMPARPSLGPPRHSGPPVSMSRMRPYGHEMPHVPPVLEQRRSYPARGIEGMGQGVVPGQAGFGGGLDPEANPDAELLERMVERGVEMMERRRERHREMTRGLENLMEGEERMGGEHVSWRMGPPQEVLRGGATRPGGMEEGAEQLRPSFMGQEAVPRGHMGQGGEGDIDLHAIVEQQLGRRPTGD